MIVSYATSPTLPMPRSCFVSYTPSPEAQLPVPIEQACAASAYVVELGRELNLDTTRLALAGDSVVGAI